jgi:2-succinyl-6-hydroxy-2,4-cyclohexadiene-1-carboxylate synthase
MKIWALHGFLGQTSDFSKLQEAATKLDSNLIWRPLDYMHLRELSPQSSLTEWGEHLNRLVDKASMPDSTGDILLGYSQGGRLALHALKADPKRWKAAILLSTNPGLPQSERPARLKHDEEWAERFLNQNFQKTLEKWNAQPVFQGSLAEPERKESDFNRRQLADCLTRWSVGQQEDFRPFLKQTSVPILYLSGEKDSKYQQIGDALAASNSKITHKVIANAAHRVLLDQPESVAGEVCRFLSDVGR